MNDIPLIDVNLDNVEKTGFFCYMSKRKTEGFKRKLDWVKARFKEGMRIKMLQLPERGFIEYIPGQYAWRAVKAEGYMFIHCLWVVGKSRGKGYAGHLLSLCEEDARSAGYKGVAMVTSERVWLAGREVLEKNEFESVANHPPFDLMVKRFSDDPPPVFSGRWEEKANLQGKGLTIIRSDQCPYIPDATQTVIDFGKQRGIPCSVVELKSCADVQNISPSPYGVFSIVLDGKLLSYHYLLPKDLEKLIPA